MCGIISKGFVSMTVAQNFFPAPSHSSVKKIFLQKFIMFRGGSGGGVKELQPPFDIFFLLFCLILRKITIEKNCFYEVISLLPFGRGVWLSTPSRDRARDSPSTPLLFKVTSVVYNPPFQKFLDPPLMLRYNIMNFCL